MHRTRFTLSLLCTGLLIISCIGCSDEDDTPTPPSTSGRMDIKLVPNSSFKYNRTDLDSTNTKIPGTTRDYNVSIKGNGGLLLGAFSDWFYRIGTDAGTNEKDTLRIRVSGGTSGSTTFSREIQAYGFRTEILNTMVALMTAAFPIQPPSIPGPEWDVIAMYYNQDGNAYDVGKEWTIGPELGTDLSFNIQGFPVTVNVKIKGKLETKDEKITVGTKQVNTWKSSLTVSTTVLGSPFGNIKVTMWFSDDPDGQIKVLQESGVFTLPFGLGSFPVPGEIQELVSYQQ